jgi:uncharacterized membrane protein
MGCTMHLRSMGQRDFGQCISVQTMSSAIFVSCGPKWYAMVPAIFAAVAIAVPFLLHSIPMLGFALQRGFALICHQQAERSFVLFGGSVAVCARCLGIYLGATAGLLVRMPRAIAMRWLTAAVVLNLVDWSAENAGLHGNWMWARFGMGFALGVGIAAMIANTEGLKTPTQAKDA